MPSANPMRARGGYMALLLAGALGGGCLRVEQTLTLRPDGSGTIALTYGLEEERARQMEAVFGELSAEGAAGFSTAALLDYSEEDVRRDFKAYEPHGVRLLATRTRTENGWRYRELQIGFDTLEGLARTDFLADRPISLTRDRRGHFVFQQAASRSGALAEVGALEQNPMLTTLLAGFRARLCVVTPGRILECNAPQRTENSATWVFDLAQDPQALDRLQGLAMRIVFSSKGLILKEFNRAASSAP